MPERLLEAHYDLSSFSNDEIDAAFDYAKGIVGTVKRAQIAAAKLRCYDEKKDRARIDQAFFDCERRSIRNMGCCSPNAASSIISHKRTPACWRKYSGSSRNQTPSLSRKRSSRGRERPLRTDVTHLQDIEEEFGVRADLGQTRSDRDLARNRITAMESSKFWKLRHRWFRVKRALHLPGWETE